MEVSNRFGVIVLCIFASGCQQAQKSNHESKKNDQYKQIAELEKQVSELKQQNKILSKSMSASVQKKKSDIQEVSDKVEDISGEHSLYTSTIESYWRKDLSAVRRLNQILSKTYPDSVHLDNALYLEAGLLYKEAQYGEALKVLNKISEKHSDGNKVVSALYLKAKIYEHLNLKEQSREVVNKIKKNYPGSAEARLIQSSRVK